MRRILKIIFPVVLFSALFIGLGNYLSQKEKAVFVSHIETIFSDAILSDLEKRLDDSGIPFFWSSMDLNHPSQGDHMTVINENGVSHIKKDSTYIRKELTKRMEIIMQGVLLKEGIPINVSVLDSIFADKLQQEGYVLRTGVRYSDNQAMETEISDPANILNKSISTQKYLLTESGDICVQGFYTLPFLVLFHKAPLPFILLFIAWLITITGFTFLTLRKKQGEEIAFVAVSEIRKSLASDPVIQVSKDHAIYFDPVKSILRYEANQTIELAPQPAAFFLALLEAPDHYMTHEQIHQLFWPKLDMKDTRDARNQAVKRFREDLSPVKQLRVDNVNRNGYKLVVLPQE